MEEEEEKDGLHGSEFHRLPDEILLKIIDLAAPNRVFLVNVMRRVCRKFRRIASDPSLWKGNVSLDFYADLEEQHVETAHAHCLNVIFNRLLHEKTVGLHVGDARRAMYGDGALNRIGIHGSRNCIYDRKIYDSVVDLSMKLAQFWYFGHVSKSLVAKSYNSHESQPRNLMMKHIRCMCLLNRFPE